MGRYMVVLRYMIPISILHVDGLSTGPLSFGVSQGTQGLDLGSSLWEE